MDTPTHTIRTPSRLKPDWLDWLWWLHDMHNFHARDLISVLEQPERYSDLYLAFLEMEPAEYE